MTGGRVERRLAAVLAADVAGYSRLMGADEVGTLTALKAHRREVVDPEIAEHRGRIVKTTGDGLLVEFASAVDAVNCAMTVQAKMAQRNSDAAQKIAFRIGINIGDVIIEGDDIFGDGVNIAALIDRFGGENLFAEGAGLTAFDQPAQRDIWIRGHNSHVAVEVAVIENMAGLYEVDVLAEYALRTPHLRLFAFQFKRVTIQKTRSQIELVFK